jgi:ribokinase
MSGRVVVVGSVNVDLVVHCDSLPRPGETVAGGSFSTHGGGKGANAAVASARYGVETLLIGAVGDDAFGEQARLELRSDRVDIERVAKLDGVSTGAAVIVVDSKGENQIAVAGGANDHVGRALVQRAMPTLTEDDVVLLNFELGDPALVAAAELAAIAGCRLIVNPAPARQIASALRTPRTVLTPNAEEVRQMSGEVDLASAAAELRGDEVAAVLVTDGPRGAYLVTGDHATRLPAPSVEAVDTTGAGDACTGVLAAALAGGAGLLEAAQEAVTAASLAVQHPGARGGLPSRSAVCDALARSAR